MILCYLHGDRIFKNEGHSLQVVFDYDPSGGKSVLSDALIPVRRTLKKIGLELEDLLVERENYLNRFCGYEGAYLVVMTHPTVLTSTQMKNEVKERNARIMDKEGTASYFCTEYFRYFTCLERCT